MDSKLFSFHYVIDATFTSQVVVLDYYLLMYYRIPLFVFGLYVMECLFLVM
jgi:hypothetical protein